MLKAKEAFILRAQRFTYAEVGDKLGCSTSVAFDLVNQWWPYARAEINEHIDIVREQELADLNRIERKWLGIALADDVIIEQFGRNQNGNIIKLTVDAYEAMKTAALVIIKVKERRAKYLGLDAPDKVQVTPGEGTMEDFRAKLREERERVQGQRKVIDIN